jgi:hypothetical protein
MVFWDMVMCILVDGHRWFGRPAACDCTTVLKMEALVSPRTLITYLPKCLVSRTKKETIILSLTPIRSSDHELRIKLRPWCCTNIHRNVKELN